MQRKDISASAGSRWGVTPFTEALQTGVLGYLSRREVFRRGDRVLVAVSGGQDSMALLLVLARLAGHAGIELAGAAHFDHRLRSREEACREREAVEAVASGLGLEVTAGGGSARGRARRAHESIEEAARWLRFGFLRREARKMGANVVALGHTRDDRAETVVLHLLRGSGLDGLIGLRARSVWPMAGRGPELARPLLEVGRRETGRYCRETRLPFQDDPSNLRLDALRNRLRRELLPAMRIVNPRLDEALSRLGDAAEASVDYLDTEADDAWKAHAHVQRRSVCFDRQNLWSLAGALRARLLRRAIRQVAGPIVDLEAVHLAATEEAIRQGSGAVSLPFGLRLTVTAAVVSVGPPRRASSIPETPLAVPGRTSLSGWTVTADIGEPPAEPRTRTRFEAWLDPGAVGDRLVVRSRRPGDRMRPLGLGGEKKLQDILVDAKVPSEGRDQVPLVCASWGIAWVVGLRIDERAAMRAGTRMALRLRFRRAQGSS